MSRAGNYINARREARMAWKRAEYNARITEEERSDSRIDPMVWSLFDDLLNCLSALKDEVNRKFNNDPSYNDLSEHYLMFQVERCAAHLEEDEVRRWMQQSEVFSRMINRLFMELGSTQDALNRVRNAYPTVKRMCRFLYDVMYGREEKTEPIVFKPIVIESDTEVDEVIEPERDVIEEILTDKTVTWTETQHVSGL